MGPIALKILFADRGKLFTATVGVIFSVVLVNIQGGLFLGLIRKAALLVEHGEPDIWIGHRNMHNVDFPRDIPLQWVYRVRSVPGVRRAEPYVLGFTDMTLPSGGFEQVFVVGVDRASLLGGAWNITQGPPDAILQTDGVIVDEGEDAKLEHPRIGGLREIGGRRARIVAKSRGIMGFLVTPYVFTTAERARRFVDKPHDVCSYILVEIEPGADSAAVCRAIRRKVPEVEAYPRETYGRISIAFWMTRTGLGISFGAATVMGLVIGLVIVAQTLYTFVLDRLHEFGTLKAIGGTNQQICRMLLLQSAALSLGGSVLGLLLVTATQQSFSSPQAPIVIPFWLSVTSCALVLGICLVSSLLPYLRVRQVDPHLVLQ